MAGGGGDGGAGEHPGAVSYWHDACEDDEDASLLCGIDFASSADFDSGLMPLPAMDCGSDFVASADFDPGFMPAMDCGGVDDGFITEIDRILESIDAETAPRATAPACGSPATVGGAGAGGCCCCGCGQQCRGGGGLEAEEPGRRGEEGDEKRRAEEGDEKRRAEEGDEKGDARRFGERRSRRGVERREASSARPWG